MSKKKDNKCYVFVMRNSVSFECGGLPCIFSPHRRLDGECCDMHSGECMCKEAQTDAMNRASGSINEELCRRANNPETWTAEHQKKAEDAADFIRRTLELDEDETVERSR